MPIEGELWQEEAPMYNILFGKIGSFQCFILIIVLPFCITQCKWLSYKWYHRHHKYTHIESLRSFNGRAQIVYQMGRFWSWSTWEKFGIVLYCIYNLILQYHIWCMESFKRKANRKLLVSQTGISYTKLTKQFTSYCVKALTAISCFAVY